MIALLNAIKFKFSNDSQLPGLFPGGIWRDRAPEGTVMPYVVTQVESAPSDTYYGEAHYNDVAVRFVAFGIGHDAVGALMESLDPKFRSAILTLTAGMHTNISRMNEPQPVLQPTVDPSGQEIWSWFVTYIYSVQN